MAFKRTPAQRKRMSDAQLARHADQKREALNGETIGLADAVKGVGLAKQLSDLVGKPAARQLVDAV